MFMFSLVLFLFSFFICHFNFMFVFIFIFMLYFICIVYLFYFYFLFFFPAQPLVATQVWLADHFTVDKAIRSTVKSATWLYCSSSLLILAIHILHCYEVWYKLDLINCANVWPRTLEHFLGKYTNIWWQIFGEKYFKKIFRGRL